MANRRMFSKAIVDSDEFLDMPMSCRLLYYDLGMRADDDGFVQPKMIMRITGAADNDLSLLIAKAFVINLENKILVIRDWKINNEIRGDRYKPTIYHEHKRLLGQNENGQYVLGSTSGSTKQQPVVVPLVGVGKDRIEEKRREEDSSNRVKNNPITEGEAYKALKERFSH